MNTSQILSLYFLLNLSLSTSLFNHLLILIFQRQLPYILRISLISLQQVDHVTLPLNDLAPAVSRG